MACLTKTALCLPHLLLFIQPRAQPVKMVQSTFRADLDGPHLKVLPSHKLAFPGDLKMCNCFFCPRPSVSSSPLAEGCIGSSMREVHHRTFLFSLWSLSSRALPRTMGQRIQHLSPSLILSCSEATGSVLRKMAVTRNMEETGMHTTIFHVRLDNRISFAAVFCWLFLEMMGLSGEWRPPQSLPKLCCPFVSLAAPPPDFTGNKITAQPTS